jgi:hypothetical protein
VAVFRYPVEFIVDAREAPEKARAEQAARTCERAYPMINAELASDGFRPPHLITLTITPRYRGVAATSRDRIIASTEHFGGHCDDVGAVVHETLRFPARSSSGASLRRGRQRSTEQFGDRPAWVALRQLDRDDVDRGGREVRLRIARRVSARRGQDGQELRKILGIVVRAPDDRDINKTTVDLMAPPGQPVPEISLVSEFEESLQVLVIGEHRGSGRLACHLDERLG